MERKILFFCFLFQTLILPQNNFIKQITSGDFDARNPFIYKNEFGYDSKIFFELHKDGYSNIYSVLYNSEQIDFEDTSSVTSGTFNNLNPAYEPSKGLIYQSNQNGNWDIIYLPVTNNIFGAPVFLTNSSEDETEPKLFESTTTFQDSLNILFKRDDHIAFLSYKNNQINEDIIFQDSVNRHYTEFAGLETEDWGIFAGHYVFAIEESTSGEQRIVRRFKPFDGNWQPKTIVLDNCECKELSFQVSGYNLWGLFFLDTLQNENRLFIIEDPIAGSSPQIVDIDYEGNISSFEMYSLLIVGKDQFGNQKADPEFYMPYSYLLHQVDGTKIRVNKYDVAYFVEDSLVSVSIANPNLAIGPVGSDINGIVVYTIWEDSIDGNIHLFGMPSHLQFGSVEDESIANDFVLYQNYPNPFNPSTKIEYRLLRASDVKLNVFNVLGEKVFEQYFGYQTAGSYKIDFNGKNLPSGVYVYSIYTNENRLSRKMVLMK